MVLLTVKRFDFSELSVSESGTVTSICLDIAFAINEGHRTARNFEDFVTDDQGIRRSRTSRTKIKRNLFNLGNKRRDFQRATHTLTLTQIGITNQQQLMSLERSNTSSVKRGIISWEYVFASAIFQQDRVVLGVSGNWGQT